MSLYRRTKGPSSLLCHRISYEGNHEISGVSGHEQGNHKVARKSPEIEIQDVGSLV